jgi:hypothetical protein
MGPWKTNTPYRLDGAVLRNPFWSFICFSVLDPVLDFLLKLTVGFFAVAFGDAAEDVTSKALHNYNASFSVSFCTEIQALLLTSLSIVR